MAAKISCGEVVAVPTLPITTPAAKFASSADLSKDAPAANDKVRVAITVSQEQVTQLLQPLLYH